MNNKYTWYQILNNEKAEFSPKFKYALQCTGCGGDLNKTLRDIGKDSTTAYYECNCGFWKVTIDNDLNMNWMVSYKMFDDKYEYIGNSAFVKVDYEPIHYFKNKI